MPDVAQGLGGTDNGGVLVSSGLGPICRRWQKKSVWSPELRDAPLAGPQLGMCSRTRLAKV